MFGSEREKSPPIRRNFLTSLPFWLLLIVSLMIPSGAFGGGSLYANFTGYGLYKWDGSAWSQLNTIVATDMVASDSTLYVDFADYGLYSWNGTAWTQINAVHPASMTASGSTLYVDFAAYGLYSWNGTTWTQINAVHPASMTAAGSTLYVDFAAYGFYSWNGTTWTQINTAHPASMVASGTDLYANFTGYGLYKWNGTSWSQLNTVVSTDMAVSGSTLYANFASYGLYKWDGNAWSQINTVVSTDMAASGTDLYANFAGYGLYSWDGAAWTQINTVHPINMVSCSQAGHSGSFDTSFGDSGVVTLAFGSSEEEARAIAIQPDGRIIVGGYADLPAGRLFAVARLLSDGSLDPAFGTDGKLSTSIPGSTWNIVNGLAIQTDGKIIAAGGYSGFVVARYNANGTLDTSFGGTGVVTTQAGVSVSVAYSVALQTDGKIIAGGSGDQYSPYGVRFTLIRYNANGTLDTTFGTGGIAQTLVEGFTATIRSVTLQPDGRIVAGGYAYNGSNYDFAFARFNADGTLDTTFGTGGTLTAAIGTGDDICYAVQLQTNGKIVAAGYTVSGGASSFALLRFETNGTLDTTFGSGGHVTTDFGVASQAYGLAIQTNGRIVVAGYAFNLGFTLARYLPDGTLDATFGTGGKVSTNAGGLSLAETLALQVDGKIIAAGFNSTGAKDFAIARFWP